MSEKLTRIQARGYPYNRKALYVTHDLHFQVKAEAMRRKMTIEAYTDIILRADLMLNAKREPEHTDVIDSVGSELE